MRMIGSKWVFGFCCWVAFAGATLLHAAEGKLPPTGFYDVKSDQAARLVKKFPGMVILDIRTPKEFQAGHLKEAKNLDFFADDFAAKLAKLDKSKAYLVHCASGGRSGRSMKIFKDQQFKTVYHLEDGYRGWVAAKKPVVQPTKP